MLTDKDEFLHAVAILFVPVFLQLGVRGHHVLELVFWHCGIPLTGIAQRYLAACLFEDIADVLLALEITDTLGTDNALRPLAGYKLVEQTEIQRTTGIINKSADAVFFGLALVMMVVVVPPLRLPRGGVKKEGR